MAERKVVADADRLDAHGSVVLGEPQLLLGSHGIPKGHLAEPTQSSPGLRRAFSHPTVPAAMHGRFAHRVAQIVHQPERREADLDVNVHLVHLT